MLSKRGKTNNWLEKFVDPVRAPGDSSILENTSNSQLVKLVLNKINKRIRSCVFR